MQKLIIVTAPRNSGKTTRLWKLYEDLQLESDSIGGYICQLDKVKSEYLLKNLENGERLLMATSQNPQDPDGWEMQGRRLYFPHSVFKETFEYYKRNINKEYLFLDEAGKLELNEKGFAQTLDYLRTNYNGTLIIAVRDIFCEPFLMRFPFENYEIQRVD